MVRDSNKEASVLVTGAGGFIGWPCVQLLSAAGWTVHGLGRGAAPALAESIAGLHWHSADLLQPVQTAELLQQLAPSHLLHLAWSTGREGFRHSPANYPWISASLHLLEAFAEAGGQRAIFVGTGAEYDWSEGRCHEQTTALKPQLTYGLCKRNTGELFHHFLQRWQLEHGKQGLSGAWARLFFLYGPREDDYRLLPWAIRTMLQGQELAFSHGRQQRDYLYVQDAAEALVRLLDSDLDGSVNVACGEAIALGELLGEVARQLDRPELLRLGARPAPADDPPLVVADTQRIRAELGWQPRWNMKRAVAQTLGWWREQLVQAQ